MSKIAVGGVVEMLTVSVDDMEEPCLLGLDSLFRKDVETGMRRSHTTDPGGRC